jgi:hypothetical protein
MPYLSGADVAWQFEDSKQGETLTRNQMEQAAEAREAARLDGEARARGLKGGSRADWVMGKLRWAEKDPRKLRRVLERARGAEENAKGAA